MPLLRGERALFLKSNLASVFPHAVSGIGLIDLSVTVSAVFCAVICLFDQGAATNAPGVAVAMPAPDPVKGFLIITETMFQRPAQISDVKMVFG